MLLFWTWLPSTHIQYVFYLDLHHRCEVGSANITTSQYHAGISVEVPTWQITTSWRQPMMRFDNLPVAVWTLFQMATLEMWSDVMYAASDASGLEQQPKLDANRHVCLFFIAFIVVGSFFILNLVIGVSIDKVRCPSFQCMKWWRMHCTCYYGISFNGI